MIKLFSRFFIAAVLLCGALLFNVGAFAGEAKAHNYVIDTKGAHAFVQFRVKHLGVSWLYGRFTDFSGEIKYDAAKPEESAIYVDVNVASLDSDHAERDKHLRSSDYLNVEKYASARFVSTSFKPTGDNTAKLKGKLSLFNSTQEITVDVVKVGEGKDPWGGYRVGFEGKTTISPADFGVDMSPTVSSVELTLSFEGIRK